MSIKNKTTRKRSRFPLARGRKRKLALIIAAHNEELNIRDAIESAIVAGQLPRDIYVVDDGSKDKTREISVSILGKDNVLSIKQQGKAKAIQKLVARKGILDRYKWLHLADADSIFDPKYFKNFRKNLNNDIVAATGYIKSLPGKSISDYRTVEYTWGMEIIRRFQSLTNLIIVIPGPSSCFRADIFGQLEFTNKTLTEDFEITLQIFRKKLGKIKFISNAIVYTQDPKNLHDYKMQIRRWYTGIFQVARLQKLGLKPKKEDIYFAYQVAQVLGSVCLFFVAVPLVSLVSGSLVFASMVFLADLGYMLSVTLLTSLRAKRYLTFSSFPQIYVMRWMSALLFVKIFMEVIILNTNTTSNGTWSTNDRRYALSR